MTTLPTSFPDPLNSGTGDNCVGSGGTGEGLLSRELHTGGTVSQNAGHVALDPCDVSHANLALSHLQHNFPSLTSVEALLQPVAPADNLEEKEHAANLTENAFLDLRIKGHALRLALDNCLASRGILPVRDISKCDKGDRQVGDCKLGCNITFDKGSAIYDVNIISSSQYAGGKCRENNSFTLNETGSRSVNGFGGGTFITPAESRANSSIIIGHTCETTGKEPENTFKLERKSANGKSLGSPPLEGERKSYLISNSDRQNTRLGEHSESACNLISSARFANECVCENGRKPVNLHTDPLDLQVSDQNFLTVQPSLRVVLPASTRDHFRFGGPASSLSPIAERVERDISFSPATSSDAEDCGGVTSDRNLYRSRSSSETSVPDDTKSQSANMTQETKRFGTNFLHLMYRKPVRVQDINSLTSAALEKSPCKTSNNPMAPKDRMKRPLKNSKSLDKNQVETNRRNNSQCSKSQDNSRDVLSETVSGKMAHSSANDQNVSSVQMKGSGLCSHPQETSSHGKRLQKNRERKQAAFSLEPNMKDAHLHFPGENSNVPAKHNVLPNNLHSGINKSLLSNGIPYFNSSNFSNGSPCSRSSQLSNRRSNSSSSHVLNETTDSSSFQYSNGLPISRLSHTSNSMASSISTQFSNGVLYPVLSPARETLHNTVLDEQRKVEVDPKPQSVTLTTHIVTDTGVDEFFLKSREEPYAHQNHEFSNTRNSESTEEYVNPLPKKKIPPLLTHRSDTCLISSDSRRHSVVVNLDSQSEKTRRNSVSYLPRRSSIVTATPSRSETSLDRIPRRKISHRQTLSKFLEAGESVTLSSSSGISSNLEFLTWNHLLATVPKSELQAASVKCGELHLTLPVCHVLMNGRNLKITSVETIEQMLLRSHPDLQVIPTVSPRPHDKSDSVSQSVRDSEGQVTTVSGTFRVLESTMSDETGRDNNGDVNGQLYEMNPQQRAGMPLDSGPKGNRRISINTCIRSMRENSGNYNSQLIGCQNVGLYADEETVKVVLAKSDAISCVINAITSFPEKDELQYQACLSLLKMASTSEANCVHICNNDGVAAIASLLRRYDDNVEIMRLVLSILGYMSTADDVTHEMVRHGCHCDVLASMSRHAHDRSIVCQCCLILGNLVISVETARQLMLVGGVHTIISMMKRYSDDVDILENGCRALGSFAVYDETCLDVAQAGATERVLAAVKSLKNDVSVKECGWWALACLTGMESTSEEFVTLDGLDLLQKTLDTFPDEEVVIENCVRVLCNLGSFAPTQLCVSTTQIVRLLVSLCRKFPESVELLEKVTTALAQVAITDISVPRSLLTEGGLTTLMTVMMSLPENKHIQENGCRVIGNMAVNEDLRKPTEQEGASRAVISAMLTLETCPEIQVYGSMALMNLTAEFTDNKIRVKNNGAVSTLLATLRNFPDQPEVLLSALKTLGNLVDLEEVCREILDDKGLSTILDIALSSREEEIRAFAALVLSGFTVLPDLPQEELLTVVSTLVSLHKTSPRNPDLALSMCQGLHNILKSDAGIEAMVREKWLDVILSAMSSFMTEPEIHVTACRVIATLSVENRSRIKNEKCPLPASAVRKVIDSMKAFPDERELQLVGCGTLSCICENQEHLRDAIVSEGGVRCVAMAMTSHPTDDRLHAVGCIALGYLLPIDTKKYPEDSVMAKTAIFRSMSYFLENKDIQISACHAVKLCDISGSDGMYEVLTCARNVVRRHGDSDQVMRAAASVFKHYGTGEDVEKLAKDILGYPTPVASEFWKALKS